MSCIGVPVGAPNSKRVVRHTIRAVSKTDINE